MSDKKQLKAKKSFYKEFLKILKEELSDALDRVLKIAKDYVKKHARIIVEKLFNELSKYLKDILKSAASSDKKEKSGKAIIASSIKSDSLPKSLSLKKETGLKETSSTSGKLTNKRLVSKSEILVKPI